MVLLVVAASSVTILFFVVVVIAFQEGIRRAILWVKPDIAQIAALSPNDVAPQEPMVLPPLPRRSTRQRMAVLAANSRETTPQESVPAVEA